ncbi:MAG: hypothetical protein NTZ02_04140 [Candidatus Woesearchaeota archaeon]|nr:hypothetical protein [Candidatus Woesearchaeota archaeon]
MASNFRETLTLFEQLGVYDVILPLLLVFTIVFAILEKTMVLGYEKIGDKKYTRKNLNSMVAFVTALLVVGSTKLVAMINETVSNTVLLLIMSVLFLILVGSFQKQTEEGVFLEGAWKNLFMIIMFVGIVMIFLNAFKLPSGESVLMAMFNGITSGISGSGGLNGDVAGTIAMFAIMIGAIFFVTASGKKKE